MVSKWCPKCGRIVTTSRHTYPNFCPWGCGSLADEPELPPETDHIDYYELVEIARKAWQERQLQKNLNKTTNNVQLKLFNLGG